MLSLLNHALTSVHPLESYRMCLIMHALMLGFTERGPRPHYKYEKNNILGKGALCLIHKETKIIYVINRGPGKEAIGLIYSHEQKIIRKREKGLQASFRTMNQILNLALFFFPGPQGLPTRVTREDKISGIFFCVRILSYLQPLLTSTPYTALCLMQ